MAIGNEGHCAGNGLIVPSGGGRALQREQGGAEEVGEEGDGDGAGAGLLTAVAADEAVEGFTGVGDEGEGEGELLELAGVNAVLEGVEVAFGGASTLSLAAPRRLRSWCWRGRSFDRLRAGAPGTVGHGVGRHCDPILERACGNW